MKVWATICRILLVLSTIYTASCSTGMKAYQRGDYYRSCTAAIERLRSDPHNAKARAALSSAYPMVTADAERKADQAAVARDVRRLESNISLYEQMGRLQEEILHCPAALEVVPDPKSYATELRETRDLVGALYYDQGLAALSAGTIESARTAVAYLKKTVRYSPGYLDSAERLAEAVYAATLRVIVTRPVTSTHYWLDADFFYVQLMQQITERTYRNLVRFYSPEEAAAEGMTAPHQVIALDFADFTIGNTRSVSDTKDCTREDVVIGTTKVNGVNQEVRGTVKARFTYNRLEVISLGMLRMTVTDPAARRVVDRRNFQNKSVWASEWASFTGDERALTDEQRSLLGRKPLPVPPPQELFRAFASPIYGQAADFIGTVYSRI